MGSIDPSLYKIVDEDDDYEIPMDHIGRVWFAVEYERETEKLLVTLMKAKNLPTRQYGNNSSCDPFIRLELCLIQMYVVNIIDVCEFNKVRVMIDTDVY